MARAKHGRSRLAVTLLVVLAMVAAAAGALAGRDAGSVPTRPPGLGDLWDGRATLVLDRLWTSTSLGLPGGGSYAGAHVEIAGDRWYLFNRRTGADTCAGRRGASRRTATLVRESADAGRTWGDPVEILTPDPGTPWSCAATDGDAVYDPRAGVWRYLFQCQADSGPWQGCYAERRGTSPMGRFTEPKPGTNPVIPAGGLWGPICDDPGDDCARPPGAHAVADEGTFGIVSDGGPGWWVGFHGFDGAQGVRGLARTGSFLRDDWQVDGAGGTPTDAVLDAGDAAGWREQWRDGGPIGAGAGSMLQEGALWYQLAEFPDISLGCTRGQSWNLGLFRTPALSAAAWEQYPGGNPIVYSSRANAPDGAPLACDVEYPGLFRDPVTGVTYLMHGRISPEKSRDGIYLYRVEWTRDLLVNGSFWRADAQGWAAMPGTTTELAVERRPDESPDGTPSLAFGCGPEECDGNQAVYQDVAVGAERAGQELAFGAQLRAERGTGRAQVAAFQLSQDGGIVAHHEATVSLSERYATARGTLRLEPATRTVRVQLVPQAPGRMRADNVHLIPQDGCDGPDYPRC